MVNIKIIAKVLG